MKCLLISHQLDYSGAPIALVELAKALKHWGADLTVWAFKDGPLRIDFEQLGVKVTNEALGQFDLLIANTVFGAQVVASVPLKSRFKVAWIHESPSFARYHPRLGFEFIPAAMFDLIAGVADFQVKALAAKFPKNRIISFDNVYRTINQAASLTPAAINPAVVKLALIAGFEPRKGVTRLRQLYGISIKSQRIIEINCFGINEAPLKMLLPFPLPTGLAIVPHGKIPRERLLGELAACDGLLSLSEDEVKPLTILEALAGGISSVVSDIPAHRELSSEFSCVKVLEDPLSFLMSADFDDLISRSRVRNKQLTLHDLDALGRYSWSAFLSRTELLLNTIANG
jgi:glycosyltransferase involved in cell wall biosynthesis